MVLFTPRPQRSGNNLPHTVGVFEDDALLLRLAARSHFAESSYSRSAGPINAEDLAFELARRVDSQTWEF
jgi:hypothetical protein